MIRLLFTILLLYVIILFIVDHLTYRNKLVIDRINVYSLNQYVREVYLIKRKLFDGYLPYGTHHLSHWGLALITDKKCFIIGTQLRHITELKLSTIEYPFVYAIEETKPYLIVEKYEVKNENSTVKDYLDYITTEYGGKEYGCTGYNCQHAVIDILNHFAIGNIPSPLSGRELVEEVCYEISCEGNLY